MMRDPKTEPIPAPDPATPTVAAPAPMNLAAESMSCLAAEVWMRLVACTVAGLMLLQAAMPRRGETERRAIADMMTGGFCWSYLQVTRGYHTNTREREYVILLRC